MLGGRESGGGRFSNPSNNLRLSPLNYISCGGPPTAATAQFGGGGIQKVQRARSLFLLPIRESNHLRWFMSQRNILWWRSPDRHPRSGTLLVLFPLLRRPAPARGLTSSTWTASHTWFGRPVLGVLGGDIPLVGGRLHLLLRARCTTPIFALRGALWSLRDCEGCCWRWWRVISSSWAWVSLVLTF